MCVRGTYASGTPMPLAHALQCLCDGRACCPARALQLVICRSGGFTGAVTLLFQLVVSHALQCLCDGRACCPVRATQLVICRSGGFTGAVPHCEYIRDEHVSCPLLRH